MLPRRTYKICIKIALNAGSVLGGTGDMAEVEDAAHALFYSRIQNEES